jgi:hypothetical protein
MNDLSLFVLSFVPSIMNIIIDYAESYDHHDHQKKYNVTVILISTYNLTTRADFALYKKVQLELIEDKLIEEFSDNDFGRVYLFPLSYAINRTSADLTICDKCGKQTFATNHDIIKYMKDEIASIIEEDEREEERKKNVKKDKSSRKKKRQHQKKSKRKRKRKRN